MTAGMRVIPTTPHHPRQAAGACSFVYSSLCGLSRPPKGTLRRAREVRQSLQARHSRRQRSLGTGSRASGAPCFCLVSPLYFALLTCGWTVQSRTARTALRREGGDAEDLTPGSLSSRRLCGRFPAPGAAPSVHAGLGGPGRWRRGRGHPVRELPSLCRRHVPTAAGGRGCRMQGTSAQVTACACARASGPWDRGAPSRGISCTPYLSADKTCSMWFSLLPLSRLPPCITGLYGVSGNVELHS
jgi:hypothetical protein